MKTNDDDDNDDDHDDDDNEDDDNDDGDHGDDDHDDDKKKWFKHSRCKRKIVHISGGYAHSETDYIEALKESSDLLDEKCKEILSFKHFVEGKGKTRNINLVKIDISEFNFDGDYPISVFTLKEFGDSMVSIWFVKNKDGNPRFELEFENSKEFSWDNSVEGHKFMEYVDVTRIKDGWIVKYSEEVAINMRLDADKESLKYYKKHEEIYESQAETVCDSDDPEGTIPALIGIMFDDFKDILSSVVYEKFQKSLALPLTSSLGSKA